MMIYHQRFSVAFTWEKSCKIFPIHLSYNFLALITRGSMVVSAVQSPPNQKESTNDVIMGAMAFQITSLTFGYLTVYSKKTSKLCVIGLCAGNSPMTVDYPAQMVSKAENVSIWWRHHDVAIDRLIFSPNDRSHTLQGIWNLVLNIIAVVSK